MPGLCYFDFGRRGFDNVLPNESTCPLSSLVLVTTYEDTCLLLFTLVMTAAVFLTGRNDKISAHLWDSGNVNCVISIMITLYL